MNTGVLCKRRDIYIYESCLSHVYSTSQRSLFLINFNSQQRRVGPRRTILLVVVITFGVDGRITKPQMVMRPVVLPEPFSSEVSDPFRKCC